MAYTTKTHRTQFPRSGMALGGIGTGWFEIRQDGGFANWQIFNNRPAFTGEPYPFNEKQTLFFVLRVTVENENPRLVLLQIEDSHGAGAIEGHEFQYMFPWLSGVDVIRYSASVPFADLNFEQAGLPLEVNLRAWSPFIPGNVKDSSLPLAYFDFTVRSTGERPVEVELLATMRNAVGYDQPGRIYKHRRVRDEDFSAVIMENGQMNPEASSTGEVTLASFDEDSTAYSGWEHHHPYYERVLQESPMPEVDDTENRNAADPETGERRADPRCFVTIGVAKRLERRGDAFEHSFALGWHFPNLYGRRIDDPHLGAGYLEDENFPGGQRDAESASAQAEEGPAPDAPMEGHYHEHFLNSSEAVLRYALDERSRLLEETSRFHACYFDSDLPASVLDQINSQLNTFRTSSWLTKTRMYGILEGLNPYRSFAGIGTTDVAMYGQIATSLLFPELDRMTVDTWTQFQNADGSVIHSIKCNSRHIDKREASGKRLDMPAQYVFQTIRAGLWSGDEKYLRALWPKLKAALAYVLRERDHNGDHLPDMEGIMCSYDNFPMYGVAPYVVTQWLAAVAAALSVARLLGDEEFVAEYETYFEAGRKTLEAETWNGSYFKLYSEHQEKDPEGEHGCMTDQIIGEGAARQLGLPEIVDPEKAATALRTVIRMNYKPEQGLRNCQWPGDAFLHSVDDDTWVDQANTCWTGVELNFAAQLYYAGMHENAETIIRNVDQRYRKFGMYFDHQEFGGHYFRPMSALAVPNAFLGLSFDGRTLKIDPARSLPIGRWCMLLPGAYGTFFKTVEGARLVLRQGELRAQTIVVQVSGEIALENFGAEWKSTSTETGGTVFERQQ